MPKDESTHYIIRSKSKNQIDSSSLSDENDFDDNDDPYRNNDYDNDNDNEYEFMTRESRKNSFRNKSNSNSDRNIIQAPSELNLPTDIGGSIEGPINPINYSGTQINVWGFPGPEIANLLQPPKAPQPQLGFLTDQMIKVNY